LASCLLGVAAVVAVGLVGRKIAGDRAGLIAAGIAAVYPQLWINDGMLVSESLYALVIAVTLLFAYRLWASRSWSDALWLGVIIGLAALTRPEAVFLVPLFGIPLLFSRKTAAGKRWLTVFIMGIACLVVILPWWVRNLTVFEKPTFLATGNGIVFQVSNCDGTYSGQFLGYWDITCLTAGAPPQNAQQREILHGTSVPGLAYLHARDPRDDSVLDTEARNKGFDYIKAHLSRVPVVVAARIGRIWGVFRPRQEVNFDIFFERRGKWPSWAGAYMYYALLPFAVYALVVMRRRRIPISPMIAIFALVTFTVALAMGITRYRVGADVALTILGGVAVDALILRFRRNRTSTLDADADPDPDARLQPA
jgi:4-amino-4-deoxy-L-arabinose transferase-like glycosyltransferase